MEGWLGFLSPSFVVDLRVVWAFTLLLLSIDGRSLSYLLSGPSDSDILVEKTNLRDGDIKVDLVPCRARSRACAIIGYCSSIPHPLASKSAWNCANRLSTSGLN